MQSVKHAVADKFSSISFTTLRSVEKDHDVLNRNRFMAKPQIKTLIKWLTALIIIIIIYLTYKHTMFDHTL